MSKKKGEHHGGAWKVAYADFVTAMMALFMVLWIIGQNPEVIQATADYFKDPVAYEHELLMGQKMISGQGATGEDGSGISKISKEKLKEIADSIYQTLNLSKSAQDKPLDIFITPDGVEMVIYNREQNPIFDEELKQLSHFGDLLIRSLAWTLDQYDGNLNISIYEPALNEPSHINHLQEQLRKEGTEIINDDRWKRSQSLLKSVFNRLVYHGFSLHKIQTIYAEKQKPKQAQHDILMIDLSLHINTETIVKR
ncbi:MAG: flagellar motor protein MotB [bacterium]